MRTCSLLLAWCAALLVAGCSSPRVSLTVDVFTDMVPGAEFARIETDVYEFTGNSEIGQTEAIASAIAEARFGMPYAFGQRVASFPRVKPQPVIVRVRMRSAEDDSVILERQLQVVLTKDQSLRIFLERACQDVVCPGSAAANNTQCQAGHCVDPRCNPEDETTREYCPQVRFCNRETDCSPVSACAVRNCISGICIPSSTLPPVCNTDEWCDPSQGCVPGGDDKGEDLCGRLCFSDATPCGVGFWKCANGTRTCEELYRRPPGSECGADRVCVESGECVTCEEGAECRIGCKMGVVSCSIGVPTCALIDPVQAAPVGSSCLDDTSYCYDVDACPGSGECLEDASCGPPSDPAIEIAPCDDDDTLVLLTDEAGGQDAICVRLRGLVHGDATHPDGLVTLALSTLDADGNPDSTEVSLSSTTLSFSRANAGLAQRVTATGLSDAINDGDVPFIVRVQVSAASDNRYLELTAENVSGVNATVCPSGFAECNLVVTDGCERNILTDPTTCGGCDVTCSYNHASPLCMNGRCAMGPCESGWSDCDGDPRNGCELQVGGSCSRNLGCRTGTWSCGVNEETGDPEGVCDVTMVAEPGTPCGESSGFTCDEVGECNTCVPGAACTLSGNPCAVGTTSCSSGHETCIPTGTNLPTNASCGEHHVCSPVGACVDVLRVGRANCSTPTQGATADQMCQGWGFSSATEGHGYSWGQCAGVLVRGAHNSEGGDDPCNGWSDDGLTCEGGFVGSTDCTGMPFYYDPVTGRGPGWGFRITQQTGGGATRYDAPSLGGHGCNGWNPGWTVMLRCAF